MPVKPPRGGNTHVDVPGGPSRPGDVDTSLPDPSIRRGVDSGLALDDLQLRAGLSRDTHADVVRPEPAVLVQMTAVDIPHPAAVPLLENYLIGARITLPDADSRGLRAFNKRTYVDLSEGGTVLVAMDPVNATYRARLPNERHPSGPELVRDIDSGLWHPREGVDLTLRTQVKKSLPELSDRQADDFVSRFGDKETLETELKRIQLGLPQLERELSTWRNALRDSPGADYVSRLSLSAKLIQLYKWQGSKLDPWGRIYRGGRMAGFRLDIDLSEWPMQRAPLFSTPINSVVSLTLRGSSSQTQQDFFAGFPSLEILRTSGQMMYGLPDGVGRLTELRVADLSNPMLNLSRADVEQLKQLPRLRELNLEGHPLWHGFSIRDMTELRVLKLGNTRLVGLPAGLNELAGWSRLQVLDLQQNPFLGRAPDVTGMSELRVLNLTQTGISQLPDGLGAENGPKGLEVLKLGENSLFEAPSLEGMSKLRELDLSSTDIAKFPEGLTSEIPGTVLNLANNRITSIPESVEIRAGFNLVGNPITDPASLRRLIHARIKTGTDVWLGDESNDRSANLWLRNVPQGRELTKKVELWDSFGSHIMKDAIRRLSRTPEYHVEYPLLQRRVWWFLEIYSERGPDEQARLNSILLTERSPGKMLDRLEAEIREHDSGRQNPPLHHLPKRPRLEP